MNNKPVIVISAVLILGAAIVWLPRLRSVPPKEPVPATAPLDGSTQEQDKAILLKSLRELPEAYFSNLTKARGWESAATRMSQTCTALEQQQALTPGLLTEHLPGLAAQLLAHTGTGDIDRACALFFTQKFAEAETLSLTAAKKQQPVQETIKVLLLASHSAMARNEIQMSLQHLRAASGLVDEKTQAPDWIHVQSQIGALLSFEERHAEAEGIWRSVIAALDRDGLAAHPAQLKMRHNLASSLHHQNRLPEAEAEFRDALAGRERALGADHPDTLESRHGLAAVLNAQGKLAEVEQQHRSILDSRLRTLGAEHPDVLKSRNNLGTIFSGQRRWKEAEIEFRTVLAARERLLGPEHSDTLGARNNVATTLHDQGRTAEAEVEYRTVLAVQARLLGAEHPDTLMSWMNLANSMVAQGRTAEAEREVRSILAIRERKWGPEHPEVFTTCYNLAICLAEQNKLQEALGFMQRAEAGRKKALGLAHPLSQQAQKVRERFEAALKTQQ